MTQKYIRSVTLFVVVVGICSILSVPTGAILPSEQVAYITRDNGVMLSIIDVRHQIEIPVSQVDQVLHVSDTDWSPDGRYLAYVVDPVDMQAGNQLYLFDMETSTSRLVVEVDNDMTWYAEWSSGGAYIALHVDNTLLVVDVEQGEIVRELNTPDNDYIIRHSGTDIQWALDDTALIIFGTYQRQEGIYSIDIETETVTPLYSVDAIYSAIGFDPDSVQTMLLSPDHALIAVVAERSLYIYNPVTDDATLMTPSELRIVFPSWSEDGGQLTFTHMSDDYPFESAVYVIDVDGTNLRPIVYTSGDRVGYWGASIRPR